MPFWIYMIYARAIAKATARAFAPKSVFQAFLIALLTCQAMAAGTPENTYEIGDGASSNKRLRFKTNASNKPYLGWSSSLQKIVRSHNGVDESPIDFFGGISDGFNFLNNPGFEDGITVGWSNTGGTFSSQSYSNTLDSNKKFARLVATTSGQKISSTLVATPDFATGGCQSDFYYKDGDGAFTYSVIDGSSNVLSGPKTVGDITEWDKAPVISFKCPTAGTTIQLVIESTGAGTIDVDTAHLGTNKGLTNVGTQMQFALWHTGSGVGSSETTSRKFTTQAETVGTGIFTSNFGSYGTNGHQVTFSQAAEVWGVYCDQTAGGGLFHGVTLSANGATNINTLTYATGRRSQVSSDSATGMDYACAPFSFTVPAAGVVRAQVSAAPSTNSTAAIFSIYAVPLNEQQQAFSPEQFDFEYRGKIISVNTTEQLVAYGAGDNTFSAGNANLQLIDLKGNAEIACVSNPSTGDTCAAGNEQPGIGLNLPRTGEIEVCAIFQSQGTNSNGIWKIIERTEGANTIVTDKEVSASFVANGAYDVRMTTRPCSRFDVTSVGERHFALVANVSGSNLGMYFPRSDEPTTTNTAEGIIWEVRYIEHDVSRPYLTGDQQTVPKSANSKAYKFDVTCDETAVIHFQPPGLGATWDDTITNGQCELTLPSGIITAVEDFSCYLTQVTSVYHNQRPEVMSTTVVRFHGSDVNAGSSTQPWRAIIRCYNDEY